MPPAPSSPLTVGIGAANAYGITPKLKRKTPWEIQQIEEERAKKKRALGPAAEPWSANPPLIWGQIARKGRKKVSGDFEMLGGSVVLCCRDERLGGKVGRR
jgi:hypothetical protein